jgi:hypothetical protein
VVGLAASLGAGISMGFAEALSDDGSLTGRGHPWASGAITGLMTALGGVGHTLPFLVHDFRIAMAKAVFVVVVELAAISWILPSRTSKSVVSYSGSPTTISVLIKTIPPRMSYQPGIVVCPISDLEPRFLQVLGSGGSISLLILLPLLDCFVVLSVDRMRVNVSGCPYVGIAETL